MLERITFLLAILGYTGLTTTAVLAAWRRLPAPLWRAAALVIVAHVALVWSARYEWQLAVATRNGYLGFVIFHSALALIVASVFVAERSARVLVWIAFGIVSLGALGAVFRYDVVAVYRAPVIALAAAGILGLASAYGARARRAARAKAERT